MFAVGNALPGATRGDLWGRTVVSGGVGVGETLGHFKPCFGSFRLRTIHRKIGEKCGLNRPPGITGSRYPPSFPRCFACFVFTGPGYSSTYVENPSGFKPLDNSMYIVAPEDALGPQKMSGVEVI